jgi:hypothetical protein
MGTPKVLKELKDHSDNEGGGIGMGGEGSGIRGGVGGGIWIGSCINLHGGRGGEC